MHKEKFDIWGRKINYKYSYNLDAFNVKEELFYYLLGVFITDGNVYIPKNKTGTKVSISSRDKDWLLLLNNIISNDNLVRTNSKNETTLCVYDSDIAKILIENGCNPNKSLTQEMPCVPHKYLKDFLRGCMDGDGSILIKNKKITRPYKTYFYERPSCYLCSASYSFIKSLSDILTKRNLKHYLITLNPKPRKLGNRIITTKNKMYRLLFDNKDCVNFLTWIYAESKIAMPRKQQIYNKILTLDFI